MSKLAVIGDKDAVELLGFAGFEIYRASTSAEAQSILDKIAPEYGIIYITKSLAVADKYKYEPSPMVVFI